MADCRKCQRFSACYSDDDDCIGFVPKQQTNGDRIRMMSDEELAYGIAHGFERPMDMSSPWCNLYCNELDSVKCGDCILKWLKKEVDENEP